MRKQYLCLSATLLLLCSQSILPTKQTSTIPDHIFKMATMIDPKAQSSHPYKTFLKAMKRSGLNNRARNGILREILKSLSASRLAVVDGPYPDFIPYSLSRNVLVALMAGGDKSKCTQWAEIAPIVHFYCNVPGFSFEDFENYFSLRYIPAKTVTGENLPNHTLERAKNISRYLKNLPSKNQIEKINSFLRFAIKFGDMQMKRAILKAKPLLSKKFVQVEK